MAKPKKVKLTPPDTARCQAERKTGCWPDAQHFMIIGPGRMERCTNVPEVIVKEVKPGTDGHRGSMSLCKDCLPNFLKAFGPSHATVTPITKS